MHLPQRCGTITADGTWTGTVQVWWYCGPLLVRLFGVRRVELLGLRPHLCELYTRRTYDDLEDADDVPAEWFDSPGDWRGYVTYATEADALADAGRRALEWARKEAEL